MVEKAKYKKIPWLAILLLLTTYITLGWFLSTSDPFWLVWVVAALSSLLLAATFASPWAEIRDNFANLFASDSKAFFVAVIAAFTSVIVISWLHIFVHGLVVTCAVLLVKLDLQKAKFRDRQIFWLIWVTSLLGLFIGWATNHLIPSVAIVSQI